MRVQIRQRERTQFLRRDTTCIVSVKGVDAHAVQLHASFAELRVLDDADIKFGGIADGERCGIVVGFRTFERAAAGDGVVATLPCRDEGEIAVGIFVQPGTDDREGRTKRDRTG